jgi:hypothetical protein
LKEFCYEKPGEHLEALMEVDAEYENMLETYVNLEEKEDYDVKGIQNYNWQSNDNMENNISEDKYSIVIYNMFGVNKKCRDCSMRNRECDC